MNQKMINMLMFTAGAAIGSLVTWRIMKSHNERYIQEEIDKFVDEWANRTRMDESEDDANDSEEEDYDENDYDETGIYDTYSEIVKKYGGEGVGDIGFPQVNGPVVITPDEFGDGNYGHSLYCLTYYKDRVLANDWLEQLDVEDTIGEEALEHFGDYAEDVVHVRNEQNGADYEVVRDPRTYAEVLKNSPLMVTHVD